MKGLHYTQEQINDELALFTYNNGFMKLVKSLESEFEKLQIAFCKPLFIGRRKSVEEFIKELDNKTDKLHPARFIGLMLQEIYSTYPDIKPQFPAVMKLHTPEAYKKFISPIQKSESEAQLKPSQP